MSVAAAVPFSVPQEVAIRIYAACKGVGTKEDALIDAMTTVDDATMPLVAYAYEHMYLEPLKKRLESETSGNFQDLLVAMALPLVEREARQLRNAIKGAGSDEGCIVDLICTKPASHIKVLMDTYNTMYKRNLADDLKSDLSGDFKKLVLALVDCARSEVFDPATVDADAGALYKAGEGKIGTDEKKFIEILTTRSFPTIAKIAEVYRNSHKHDLETAIEKETSGYFRDGMRAIVITATRGAAPWFATALNRATKGAGTNDARLIRVVANRRSVDLRQIKEAFASKYGESLEANVAGDVSGSYGKLLMALLSRC
eukprot:TRINITY_DN10467_c0_g1_i1.p1 TRINITY_DN10467_c0_g1~~TRINITY_DN10467_c0_g1_i1.p1  ORF type:complete len:327 (-),score=93.47 TRINITY_DN10467_c0_g1_i1:107-1048(-)